MRKLINIKGKKFNKLKVKKYVGNSKWLCKCDCGNEKIVLGSNLKNGCVKSCGCLRVDVMRNISKLNITHGDTGTNFYHKWENIKNRCNNKNVPIYKRLS